MFKFFASDDALEKKIEESGEKIKEVVQSESAYQGLLQRVRSYLSSNEDRVGGGLKTSVGTLSRFIGAYLSGKYRDVSTSTLSLIAFGFLYFVSPLDLIPDALVPLGFVDDAFVVAWVIKKISSELGKFRLWERAELARNTLEKIPKSEIKDILLLGGWFSKTADYREHLKILQKLFPGTNIEHFKWDANGMWNDALKEADHNAPPALKERLETLDIGKTLLIGHSLGGRVLLRTLQLLDGPVLQVILMGTAIDHDDPDVPGAVIHSRNDLINVYSKNDGVLRYLYQGYERRKPLGLCGTEKDIPGVVNLKVAGTEEHIYGWIENVADFMSIVKSKVPPVHKIGLGSHLIDTFGNMNKHQCLEYLRFVEKGIAGSVPMRGDSG